MAGLFRSPLRVYLALVILSLIGIWSAMKLPISLFPNSSKPHANLCVGSDLSPEAFLRTYGESIESQIRAIRRPGLEVEQLAASYSPKQACYEVDFKWGGDDDEATREMELLKGSVQSRLPQEWRDRVRLWSGRDGGGFLALSFYSNERSLTDLYKIIEPVLAPKLAAVKDAHDPGLWNPQRKQIQIELRPEALASFQLFPSDVAAVILGALDSYSGGSLMVGTNSMVVEFPRAAEDLDAFRLLRIPTAGGKSVSLGQVAKVDLTIPLDSSRVIKTSGAASVMLFANPRPGGNVKSMAEDIIRAVDETMPSLPPDIKYSKLVDPSEFIRSAVTNVTKEVALAATLAVIILFLFVGNLKNVITAAIEIPLSLVLAFILMRLSGMNLNLISLGGLALSAGMNVDASVVVMENIFRHFEEEQKRLGPGVKLGYEDRLRIIVEAVREVQFAVIASTIASLVVFLPLAFTSDLSYAILGDLAKAVVFSHGFSAIVALVLVPTIRLHVMKDGMTHEKPSFLELPLQRLELAYSRALGAFLEKPALKIAAFATLAILFLVLAIGVAPRLPREIIGKPDTDSIFLSVETSGNSVIRQMEAQSDQVEADILNTFGDKVAYTFTQISRPNSAFILLRLKDKHEMKALLAQLEERFQNTPTTRYFADAWNPAEMPLPDPPDFKISIRGSDREAMLDLTRDLETEINDQKIFPRVSVQPGTSRDDSIEIRARSEQWPLLAAEGARMSLASLADLTRTATEGHNLGRIQYENEQMDVFMKFPEEYVTTPNEIGALPVGINDRIVPLKAIANISVEPRKPMIRRENEREAYILSARNERGAANSTEGTLKTAEAVKRATELVENWPRISAERRAKRLAQIANQNGSQSGTSSAAAIASAPEAAPPLITIEDAKVELNDALKQLAFAVSLSIALIFLTMVFQFGSVMNSLLVLVAVPLGFIGVVISLFVFQSTLSLNSLLGIILLNGLAVANSIILVDFLQRKVREGEAPRKAAVEVARVRLRPILMTSLTTGLGMLPIAMGFGEGGKILQPLGIAVAGGLGFSMVTTLFIVPALQVAWLEKQARRRVRHA